VTVVAVAAVKGQFWAYFAALRKITAS